MDRFLSARITNFVPKRWLQADLNIADIGLEAGPHSEVNSVLERAFNEGRAEDMGIIDGVRVYKIKGVGEYLVGDQRGHAGLARNQIYIAEDSFGDQFLKQHEIEELKLWQRKALEIGLLGPETKWGQLDQQRREALANNFRIYLSHISSEDRLKLSESIHQKANRAVYQRTGLFPSSMHRSDKASSNMWDIIIDETRLETGGVFEGYLEQLSIAHELLDGLDKVKVVKALRAITENKTIEDSDLNNDVRISYHAKGSRKYVFRVTFGLVNGGSATVLMAAKFGQRANSIEQAELVDLQRLLGKGTPRFGLEFKSLKSDRVIYVEEFIQGPTAWELASQGKLTPDRRKAIVRRLLSISKDLKGWVPRDFHAKNFIFREGSDEVIMVDLGHRRFPINGNRMDVKSRLMFLAMAVAQYGMQESRMEADIIFDTVREAFGEDEGLSFLSSVDQEAKKINAEGVKRYLHKHGENTFWLLATLPMPVSLEDFSSQFVSALHAYVEKNELNIADIGLQAGPHGEVNAVLEKAFAERRVKDMGIVKGVRVYKVSGVGKYLIGKQRGHAGLARNHVYIAEDSFNDQFLKEHEIQELKLWQRKALEIAGFDAKMNWEELGDEQKRILSDQFRSYLLGLSPLDRDALIQSVHDEADYLAAGQRQNQSIARILSLVYRITIGWINDWLQKVHWDLIPPQKVKSHKTKILALRFAASA